MDKRLVYTALPLLTPPDSQLEPRELLTEVRDTLDSLEEMWDTLEVAELVDEGTHLVPQGKLAGIALAEIQLAALIGALDIRANHSILKEYSNVRAYLIEYMEKVKRSDAT